jgi:hypothetical protein
MVSPGAMVWMDIDFTKRMIMILTRRIPTRMIPTRTTTTNNDEEDDGDN